MPAEHEYICTNCGRQPGRDLLTAKKVLFVEMGAGGKTIRSRVVDWLCPDCVKSDPVWRMPPHQTPSARAAGKEIRGE